MPSVKLRTWHWELRFTDKLAVMAAQHGKNRGSTESPREAAVAVLRRLREAGYTAYLAGGCVRDALLGQRPKDYDIATDARPEQVRGLFKRSKYVGEAFGVVQVYRRGQAIEVATFREEWGYADGRRPDTVHFTDARHDAARRDFTINGLFADPITPGSSPAPGSDTPSDAGPGGRAETPSGAARGVEAAGFYQPESPSGGGGDAIIDYVGGQADLREGLIRAIGDPAERFGEDYLRMLRAIRFAARLGFDLEPTTAAAIEPLADRLNQISRERVGQEIRAMLTGPDPAGAATLIQHHQLDAPALNEEHQDPAVPTMSRLATLTLETPEGTDAPSGSGASFEMVAEAGLTYPLMLAAWLIDRHVWHDREATNENEPADTPGPPAALTPFVETSAEPIVRRWRKALNLSNADREALHAILWAAAAAGAWDELGQAGRKRLLARPAWPAALWLLKALSPGEPIERLEREAAPLRAEGVAPAPLLSGADLIAAGLKPGPRFGQLLEQAYDAQLEGELTDREQALQWLAEQER